jgi:Protein of unknown function (DUF3233).
MSSRLIAKTAPGEINAVGLEPTGVHASHPVNTLNQFYQLQKWQEIKHRTLIEIERIDELLAELRKEPGCEQYAEILIRWYVDKENKEDIAENLGHSIRNLYRIKESAIQKFSVMLFGIEALKAM